MSNTICNEKHECKGDMKKCWYSHPDPFRPRICVDNYCGKCEFPEAWLENQRDEKMPKTACGKKHNCTFRHSRVVECDYRRMRGLGTPLCDYKRYPDGKCDNKAAWPENQSKEEDNEDHI